MDPGFNLDKDLTRFGVFQIGITSVDVGTDGFQAYDHYKNENYWWATSTVTIIFIPFFTSLSTELLNNLIKYCRGDEVCWKDSFKKIGRHFPLVQTVVHLIYFLTLRTAKNTMIKAHKFYKTFDPKDVSTKNGNKLGEDEIQSRRVHYRSEIEKAASAYVEAKEAYTKNLTEFQELKLYEAFGEAAPQAVLQFAIVLQLGYISPLQITTIIYYYITCVHIRSLLSTSNTLGDFGRLRTSLNDFGQLLMTFDRSERLRMALADFARHLMTLDDF